MTLSALRSVAGKTLAMLRWTNTWPGSAPKEILGGDATVGAADVQHLGSLASRETLEVLRIALACARPRRGCFQSRARSKAARSSADLRAWQRGDTKVFGRTGEREPGGRIENFGVASIVTGRMVITTSSRRRAEKCTGAWTAGWPGLGQRAGAVMSRSAAATEGLTEHQLVDGNAVA